jgi:hypothetical protein
MTDFLTARLRQRYAVAEGDAPWVTVELYHPTFEDGAVRFVTGRDYGDPLSATLEADAPRDAGESVDFEPMAFDMIPPGMDGNGPTPARVRMDNVSGEILRIMRRTITTNEPVEIIYREFDPDDLSEPGGYVRDLFLKNVTVTGTTASAEIGRREVQVQAVSREVYDRARFPALFVR